MKIVEAKLMNTNKNQEQRHALFMLLPQIIGFLIFGLYPIIWIMQYAWFDYDGSYAAFTGFYNFTRVFRDIPYWKSVLNTFVLSFGKLVIELGLALILAVILNSKIKMKFLYRTIFYLPNVISVSIVGIIFYFMFATYNGIVNNAMIQMSMINKAWAKNEILLLANKGIIAGRGNSKFAPSENITREEFIKILTLAFGIYNEKAECKFTDVGTDFWAYSYIASAMQNNITSGVGNDQFGVGDYITREDMEAMLYRTM